MRNEPALCLPSVHQRLNPRDTWKWHFLPHCRASPLKVSQTTAVALYEHSAISEDRDLKEPNEIPNDATNAWSQINRQKMHNFLEKRTHLCPKIRKTTSASVEDIIVNSPGNFNHLQRNMSKFYDALEANQPLRKGGLIPRTTPWQKK